jgi:hypothetical protein
LSRDELIVRLVVWLNVRQDAGRLADRLFNAEVEYLDDEDRLIIDGLVHWYTEGEGARTLDTSYAALDLPPPATQPKAASVKAAPPSPAPVEAFTDGTGGTTDEGGAGGGAVTTDAEDAMSDGGVLTVKEKAAFEAKYPYAFLDDNPYVISQHVHDPAKFAQLKAEMLPLLAEEMGEMLQEYGIREDAIGLTDDQYAAAMAKLNKRRTAQLQRLSPAARQRVELQRKFMKHHLMMSAEDAFMLPGACTLDDLPVVSRKVSQLIPNRSGCRVLCQRTLAVRLERRKGYPRPRAAA